MQPDGKVIIQGFFGKFNELSCGGLVRLNSTGSVDIPYSFPGNSYNGGLALQPDGKLLVSGGPGVLRLNGDGTVDNSFNFNAGAPLYTFHGGYIALQPDGKIVMCGTGQIEGHVIYTLARLNSNGTLDTTFNEGTGVDRSAFEVTVQPDGKIFVTGVFDSYNGTAIKKLSATELRWKSGLHVY